MKNKYLRVVSSVLALSMMLVGMSGCSNHAEVTAIEPMEIEEVAAQSFDIIGGKDVMPITGYYGPYRTSHGYNGNIFSDNLTDEWFQAVADCGINVLSNPQFDYASEPQTMLRALDLAEKYGIGLAVKNANITGNYEITTEEAIKFMKNYVNHPAYIGHYIYDEPGNSKVASFQVNMSQLVNLTKVLNLDGNTWNYMNVCGGTVSEAEAYDGYLKEFCETMNNPVISFDNYELFSPDDEKKDDHSDYLWNVAMVKKYSDQYNKPFWAFVGCGGQYNDAQAQLESIEYHPNEGQFDWCVNMMLAFGAKGLNYFTVSQPYYYSYGPEEGEYDFQRNSIISVAGNKTQWWHYAKNINTHIAAIDEVLMNSVNKGMIITGEKALKDARYITEENFCDESILLGNSWRELAKVSGEAIVGCFNYQGNTALYVVNYETDNAQKVDLEFVTECNIKMIQNAETSYVKGDSMTLDLAAGEGVLLVFE